MERVGSRYSRTRAGLKPVKPRIVIATEGTHTERAYFSSCLGGNARRYTLEFVQADNASAPRHVLRRMERHLRGAPLGEGDEAWIVVDRDNWPESDLNQISDWARSARNRFLALSNPKFEYWLLLHFEDASGVQSNRDCDERLRKNLPNYEKSTLVAETFRSSLSTAVERARLRDTPPCGDWPRTPGSTVYRLVERLLQFST